MPGNGSLVGQLDIDGVRTIRRITRHRRCFTQSGNLQHHTMRFADSCDVHQSSSQWTETLAGCSDLDPARCFDNVVRLRPPT